MEACRFCNRQNNKLGFSVLRTQLVYRPWGGARPTNVFERRLIWRRRFPCESVLLLRWMLAPAALKARQAPLLLGLNLIAQQRRARDAHAHRGRARQTHEPR